MFDVFQIGRRMHYAVPNILERSGKLRRFYTDLVLPQKMTILASKIPAIRKNNAFRRLISRAPNDIPNNKIVSFPWLGLSFAGMNSVAFHRLWGKVHPVMLNEIFIRNIVKELTTVIGAYCPEDITALRNWIRKRSWTGTLGTSEMLVIGTKAASFKSDLSR